MFKKGFLNHAIFLVLPMVFSGCAKIAHTDQLLTLKSYSDNQDLQEKAVTEQNRKFEKLLAVVKDGSISSYANHKAVLKKFGEPVFSRTANKDGQDYELWLYRYATKYFNSEKVYLYFDVRGQLKKWELVSP